MSQTPGSVTPVKTMSMVDSSWRLMIAFPCLHGSALTKQHNTGGWKQINCEIQDRKSTRLNSSH